MSCADVCIGMFYDGDNEFYEETLVTARKEHRCCECGASIAKGDRYQRAKGKNGCGFFSEATCLVCVEVREAFTCGSWIFGDLWESVRSDMFPVWKRNGPWDCLAKLQSQAAIDACMSEFREWLGEVE